MGLSHDELIARGKRWLLGTMRCWVAQDNAFGDMREYADVMGWTSHHSHLIECKTSLGDFRADKKKRARGPENGLGEYRWYMAEPGVISVEEVPQGWGLLEVHNHCVRRVKSAIMVQLAPWQWRHERLVVVRALSTSRGVEVSRRIWRDEHE